MKFAVLPIAICASAAWWLLGSDGLPPRRDGQWDVAMQAQLPGVDRDPPPITFSQCVTKEDLSDPTKSVPLGSNSKQPDFECKVAEQTTDGAEVSWTTECSGLNPMTGRAKFVYGVNQYVGTMVISTIKDGVPVTMTMKYTGTRRGDC